MSNRPVSLRKWRTALTVLALVCLSGTLLAVALSLGAADPTRPPAHNWVYTADFSQPGIRYPLHVPPYGIELKIANKGNVKSWWGLWIGGTSPHNSQVFVIDNEGYMSVGLGDEHDWQQFIHLTAKTNSLHLDVSSDSSAIFYINNEIAWKGTVPFQENRFWGVAQSEDTNLDWQEALRSVLTVHVNSP